MAFPRRLLFVALCLLMAFATVVQGQMTTGNISGTVTAGGTDRLPGVTIEAIHVPTNTKYSAVSGSDGRFLIPNVRVGGPYRITATLEGFRTAEVAGVHVALGSTADVPVAMQLAAVAEAITVTADVDPIINPDRTGSASAVSEEQIETLPTVNRMLQDYARTNPYFTTSLTGDGDFMFVAGRNNRYNNISIDGAVNNDLFGLAASGTPGGQAGTQPVSLDAIEQLQLVVSPYDIRQSGFTGGAINAVTRSGSNDLEGSFFGSRRDPAYVGKGISNTRVSDFDHTQYGGRVGGPILRDRLFYFLSGEANRREEPDGRSADGSTPTVYNNANPNARDVADFVKNTYNYDPGSLGELVFETKSDLLFGRIDANLGSSHNLTLRHNYVKGNRDNTPSSFVRSSTRFYFPTNIYRFPSETNSTVAQLNSVFSQSAFNEARVNFQTVRESRDTPIIFPTVELGPGGERAGTIQLGTERFSGANALNQDILQITNDFTWSLGAHKLIFGTHNEIFEFSNLFIQDFYGYYHFPNFDAFKAGTPDIYRIGFASGSNPRRPTQFKAARYAIYASDQWHAGNGLTLTMGLRASKPQFSTRPTFNPAVLATVGHSTAETPSESVDWEPRIGFNWDINGRGNQQLRGGIGMFQGRTPFVWISNNYGNTGVELILKGCTGSCITNNNIRFNPNPSTQPRLDNIAGATQDIALSDPDFRFPRVLRSTLGYDRDLFWGIKGTIELLWSKVQQDVFYQNVVKLQTGTSPLDGRPTYENMCAPGTRCATGQSSPFGNAYYLTNTNKGDEVTQTIQLNKSLRNVTLSANYAHQKARSVGDWTSSTPRSQWEFGNVTNGDIYKPVLSPTAFEMKHRFNFSGTYRFETGPLSHALGLYYVAQSGQPYSLLIGGDPNRDGSVNNELLFVPGANSLILCPSTASAAPSAAGPCRAGTSVVTPLDANRFYDFLRSAGVDTTGGLVERNSLQSPWTRRIDLHYEIGLPQILGTRAMIQADILNLANLLDKEAGQQQFVSFNTYMPVAYVGTCNATGAGSVTCPSDMTGKHIYREAASGRLNPGNQFSTANIASRWQGRLGIRVNF